jgi:hypothetical protein
MYVHTEELSRSESDGSDNSMCVHMWLGNSLDGQELLLSAPDGSLENFPVI